MKKLLAFCITLVLLALTPNSVEASMGSEVEGLPPCVVVSHCSTQTWTVTNVERTFKKAVDAVSNTPRTKIIDRSDNYIHAEAQTKWRRYTDDLLIKAFPEQGKIQVRSESRVGIGDNGVNKKRIDSLAYRVMTDQIS